MKKVFILISIPVFISACKTKPEKPPESFSSLDSLVQYVFPGSAVTVAEVIPYKENPENMYIINTDTFVIDDCYVFGFNDDTAQPQRGSITYKNKSSFLNYGKTGMDPGILKAGTVFNITTKTKSEYIAVVLHPVNAVGTMASRDVVGIINIKDIGTQKEIILFENEHTTPGNFIDYKADGTLEFLYVDYDFDNLYHEQATTTMYLKPYLLKPGYNSPEGLVVVKNNAGDTVSFTAVVGPGAVYGLVVK